MHSATPQQAQKPPFRLSRAWQISPIVGVFATTFWLSACGEKAEPAPAAPAAPAAPQSALQQAAEAAVKSSASIGPAAAKPPQTEAPSDSAATVASNAAPATPAADSAASFKEAGSKLNYYIQCSNDTQSLGRDAMRRYQLWVKDMEAGPTGSERTVYGIYTILEHLVDKCGLSMQQLAGRAPAIDGLDAAAANYAVALTDWAAVLQKADKYYSREDYKDDAMAMGKAMHPDIVVKYGAFDAAGDDFSEAIERENDKRSMAQLVQIEQTEGRQQAYWQLSTMIHAKRLVNIVAEESFDVAQATAQLDDYEAAMNGFVATEKNPLSPGFMALVAMQDPAEKFLIAVKQRIRLVRDAAGAAQADPSASSGSGSVQEGSAMKVVDQYNQLVGISNML